MFRKIILAAAGVAVFLSGAYAEEGFQITPVATAAFRTGKMLLGDLYSMVLARIPGQIETTSALVALAGFLALISLKYLARARRM